MASEHEQLALTNQTFRSLERSTAVVLEFLIAVYVASLILVVATGGIDIGPIGLHDATKPILILLILLPLRLSIDAAPSFLGGARDARRLDLLRRLIAISEQIPRAVKDTIVVVCATRIATFSIGFVANVIFTPYRT